jgi:FkbM family methyltransferase
MKVDLHGIEFEVAGDEHFWTKSHLDLWEPETFNIVKMFASNEKAFIDIGAWNGVVSLYASHFYNSVLSVEPDVTAFDKLNRNIELNGILTIKSVNVALSNTNGSSILNISGKGDSMSSLLPRNEGFATTNDFQGVETKTFESLISHIKKPIGLIKMDIEGGELFVIPQMIDYLQENKIPIYISFHPFWFPEENKGYQILWLAEALFGIYPVVKDAQLNIVTKEEFIEGLFDNSFSYLFIP